MARYLPFDDRWVFYTTDSMTNWFDSIWIIVYAIVKYCNIASNYKIVQISTEGCMRKSFASYPRYNTYIVNDTGNCTSTISE